MKTLAFCAMAVTLAIPGVGLAASSYAHDAESAALAVRHDDLNLATPRGARLMIQRLNNAAADVCGASSFVSLAQKVAVRNTACFQASMNRAVADLGSPTVQALYNGPAVRVASK